MTGQTNEQLLEARLVESMTRNAAFQDENRSLKYKIEHQADQIRELEACNASQAEHITALEAAIKKAG